MTEIIKTLGLNFNILENFEKGDITFLHPHFLYFLFIIPLYLVYYFWTYKKQKSNLLISNISESTGKRFGSEFKKYNTKSTFIHILALLKSIVIALIIIAIARPQSSSSRKEVNSEGIDIVMAMDLSTSMLAEDLKPNRIEAAKKTAIEFVNHRENDRIGLVVFAGESYTSCPVTSDHTVVKNLLSSLKSGTITDGTAIGLGLSTAISRLKDSKSKSKVIVLLTDGSNNAGNIAPETAAEIALTFGIKVYTIGVGTKGFAPYPVVTPFGKQYMNVEVDIDEVLLKKIAETTSGQYFRATNNKSLTEIYNTIDKMETTKIEQFYFTKKTDEYMIFAFLGLIIFLIEYILRYTYFRTLP